MKNHKPIPKRGRPEADADTLKSVSMTICLTPSTHKKLKDKCKKLDIPPATMVRQLIERAIKVA